MKTLKVINSHQIQKVNSAENRESGFELDRSGNTAGSLTNTALWRYLWCTCKHLAPCAGEETLVFIPIPTLCPPRIQLCTPSICTLVTPFVTKQINTRSDAASGALGLLWHVSLGHPKPFGVPASHSHLPYVHRGNCWGHSLLDWEPRARRFIPYSLPPTCPPKFRWHMDPLCHTSADSRCTKYSIISKLSFLICKMGIITYVIWSL